MSPLFVVLQCNYHAGDDKFIELKHKTVVNITQITHIECDDLCFKVSVRYHERPLSISPEEGESLLQYLKYHQYL
jgi:hypothetical protein